MISMLRSKLLRLLFALCAATTWAAEVMPPAPKDHFNDFAHVVSSQTAQTLNRVLEDFEKQTSSQVVVAVFPTMQSPSSIEDYVHRIFVHWQIGQKEKNNGVLLAVFVREHRMRIEVGYGLEGALPDALAKRIIDEEITPHLRRGNFDAGLQAGVTAILQAIRGEYKGTGRTAAQGRNQIGLPVGLTFFLLICLVILSVFMKAIRGMRGVVYRRSGRQIFRGGWGGGWSGGGWSGGGWSGGGGGDSSAGSFSGGGGDSGGGGASGSW